VIVVIKSLLDSNVFSLILAGIAYMIPGDTNVRLYISYAFYSAAVLLFCYNLFKHYRLKKNNITTVSSNKTLNQSIPDGYIQDENVGWLIESKADRIFCLTCWYDNNILVQLIKDKRRTPDGFICPKCNEKYSSLLRAFINSPIMQYFIVSAKAKSRQESKKKSAFNKK